MVSLMTATLFDICGILSVEETARDQLNAHGGEISLAGNVEEDLAAV